MSGEDTMPAGLTVPQRDEYLSGWYRHASGELLEGFRIGAEDTVVDVGCGDGHMAHFAASRGAEVIFADVDPAKVARVGELLSGLPARAVRGLVSDANPLPLPDARASRVIATEVLEHVDDPVQFMAELVRIGAPGAQYLLTVPDALIENLQRPIAAPAYFEKPNHIRVFTRDAFEALVTESGLVVERRVKYGFYWSIWWCFFWACKHDLDAPWHELLRNWDRTWGSLLELPDGMRIKRVLDEFMPKSQALVARKP
jgi:SAM-dependent methyltransferase